jgi:hypothetical protein
LLEKPSLFEKGEMKEERNEYRTILEEIIFYTGDDGLLNMVGSLLSTVLKTEPGK